MIVEIDDVEVGLDVFSCLGKFADVIGEKRQRLRVAVRTTMFMKLAPLLDFPRRALVLRVGVDPLENFAIALAGGKLFVFRGAFCMEPSRFPDGPNKPGFPSTLLNPGDWYTGRIVYKFSVRR